MGKKWFADAPSNIALIKYMGKTDTSRNRPTNTSLSYTLPHLKSLIEIESLNTDRDRWEPLAAIDGKTLAPLHLSEKGEARFLTHLDRLKKHFGFSGNFVVRSANDFPSDCGLASSASSFAALTKAAVLALTELTGAATPKLAEVAELSRLGSGSSCRSFFAPWSQWDADGARGVDGLGYADLIHQCVVVNDKVKTVSSSQAHVRVASSDLFRGRPERAEERVGQLLNALNKKDWPEAFELSWAEFWDMHALFETAKPSFGYMTPGSFEVLRLVCARTWETEGKGPLVTMDAGPNVHLLYQRGDEAQARAIHAVLAKQFLVISNLGAD